MSARKLGRLAGLVFVLATILGGIGAATAAHAAGGSAVVTGAIQAVSFETVWG
jgi:hypothetical protein